MNSTEIMLGKVLGEIYRLQEVQGICEADPQRIYGLLNGFEDAISEELERVGFIAEEKVDFVCNLLDEISNTSNPAQFTGYYDIERQLKDSQISRSEAISIFRSLISGNQYTQEISKMDSDNSPSEVRVVAKLAVEQSS